MSVDSLESMIRKFVLANALEHNGVAQPKSVLGKILNEFPELRAQSLQMLPDIEKVAREVNGLSQTEQQTMLSALGGYTAKPRTERVGLPELEVGKKGFVVRFAPNPDGSLHLGNARPAILCDEYAKKYNGKFILRFDDTDPKIKVPEAKYYKWIREDLKWLGVTVHKEYIASKRLPIYYQYAEDVIKKGGAYVCTCETEKWRKLRNATEACPCRNRDVKTVLKQWKQMLAHKYKEGQAVLRIKTDIAAKNPAVRDWPAFRIVDQPKHPLQKKKCVWPLYNFASAIDDYLLSVTHIFRAQEHATNETKQRYLYQYFCWSYPFVITLGRFSLSDMVLSKSMIREGIRKRKFAGWDDLHLGTIKTLRRRGFLPQTLRQIIVEIGPKPSDITISMENLAAFNRKNIDAIANRYFFIPNPMKIKVKKLRLKTVEIPVHPDNKKKTRKFALSDTFFIDASDFDRYRHLEVRLKDLINIKLDTVSEVVGNETKSIPKVQWLPVKHLTVRVYMPDKDIMGYGETALAKAKVGDIAQFERFGFVKIEKVGKNNVVVVFAHP
ncbi:MAG: glutamate--tRNA ligase [Candidatus Aenigmarchaeota archaeon]|nr:glutamate--tRNA ligase [Candidatus Aenigmarchaeota archaeon]